MASDGYLENWFGRISNWSPMEVAQERYAWIQFHGVPLHAWTRELFEMLLSSFGRFVTMDDNTFMKNRLDIARILLLMTSPEPVHWVMKVKINGLIYSIRVVEELYGTQPIERSKKNILPMVVSDSESDGGDTFSGDYVSEFSFTLEPNFEIQNPKVGESKINMEQKEETLDLETNDSRNGLVFDHLNCELVKDNNCEQRSETAGNLNIDVDKDDLACEVQRSLEIRLSDLVHQLHNGNHHTDAGLGDYNSHLSCPRGPAMTN